MAMIVEPPLQELDQIAISNPSNYSEETANLYTTLIFLYTVTF